MQVFVSHSSQDRRFVEAQLVPYLKSLGTNPWYSRHAIRTAQQWEDAIRDALQTSEWVAVVVSKASSRSAWVKTEVDWALEHREGRVAPVCVDHTKAEELHLRLRLVQSLDWANAPSLAKAALTSMLGKPTDPKINEDTFAIHDLPHQYARPQSWYCIFCGWKCGESYNDYLCKQCARPRPFAGGSATMTQCASCRGWSLALARYCEWCGEQFGHEARSQPGAG
jgi:TIR domain